MRHIIDQGLIYGLDIPKAIGFAVACLLSWYVNRGIAKSQILKFPELIPKDTQEADKEQQIGDLMEIFDLPGAALVGILERVIYIFSVMGDHYELAGGWIIMKSFTMWLESPLVKKDQKMKLYHNYIVGSALSLLAGVACGEIGNVIADCFTAGAR